MVLYPKERASHQSDMDASADKYNARAKSFIDDLYASHAEGAPKTAAADKPKIPEADLDAYINGTAKLTGDTPSKKSSDFCAASSFCRSMSANQNDRNKRTGLILLALVAGMVFLTYKSADFYKLFCKVTGSGGQATKAEAPSGKVYDREITVRFNSDVNPDLAWDFKPDTPSVKVKIGQEVLVSFTAKNLSNVPIAGTAIYSIAPDDVGVYFNKTQCFCFNYQLIAPGKTAHFPVVFYIDPKILKDRTQDGLKNHHPVLYFLQSGLSRA